MSYALQRRPLLENNIKLQAPKEPATEEEAMHPVIIQAAAAERSRDMQAHRSPSSSARRSARIQPGDALRYQ